MFLRKILLTETSEPNYLFLLIALMIMITFPVFALFFENTLWVFRICYNLVILTSILYSYEISKKITLSLVLGVLAFLSYWFEVFVDTELSQTINLLISFAFFAFLLFGLMVSTIKENNVTINTLYAVSVGYLLLGFMGFWLLTFLDVLVPESFIGNFSDYRGYDLIYFSFVTLTSLGYGDIQAINPEGKAICLLIGIVGQLYISFTVAIIVGKYLTKERF